MPLRVLVVARWYPSHDNPGRGSFVADLVEALTKEDVEITVASWEDARLLGPAAGSRQGLYRASALWNDAVSHDDVVNAPQTWGAGVPVARLPALRIPNETVAEQVGGHAALLLPFGKSLHARWPFDVIHAHVALPDGLAAIGLGRELGLPVVVTEHDRSLRAVLAQSSQARDAYRQLLRDADRVFAVSQQFRSLLMESLGMPETGMSVLPNAIPTSFFQQPLDDPRDMSELLYVGHRLENKGTPVLLEAFAAARSVRPDLRLRLVGRSVTPDDEDRWHDMAEMLGISSQVIFDPPTDRLGVARAMVHASALVHPSPFESFGMIVAEALACGLPVVATRSGVEEILGESGEFGELADGIDPGSLSKAIVRLLERRSEFDPEHLRRFARAFEATSVARRTITQYDDVIGLGPGDGRSRPRQSRTSARSDQSCAALVVGLRRPVAERLLSTLPNALSSAVTLVTEGAEEAATRPALRRVIEIHPEAEYRARMAALGHVPGARWGLLERALRFVRSPRASLERRRLRRNRDSYVISAAMHAIAAAWERHRADAGSPMLLPIDVNDLLASEEAIARGAKLTPGGTRWLADRWDAATDMRNAPRSDRPNRRALSRGANVSR